MYSDYCPTCEEDREFRLETREKDFKYRGETIQLSFPQRVCTTCGEVVNDRDYGDPLEKVHAIYRQRHQPESEE